MRTRRCAWKLTLRPNNAAISPCRALHVIQATPRCGLSGRRSRGARGRSVRPAAVVAGLGKGCRDLGHAGLTSSVARSARRRAARAAQVHQQWRTATAHQAPNGASPRSRRGGRAGDQAVLENISARPAAHPGAGRAKTARRRIIVCRCASVAAAARRAAGSGAMAGSGSYWLGAQPANCRSCTAKSHNICPFPTPSFARVRNW